VNVIFRADASYRIGAGHVIRCLTLADILGDRGARSCFICRQLPDSLEARIRSHGHDLIQLATPQMAGDESNGVIDANPLGVSQEHDARQTRDALHGRRCDWLIVDHYGLDYRWERALRDAAPAILVIDDLANRRHECDLLLDQNYYSDLATRYENLLAPHVPCLLGPKFALLHPQFAAARASSRTMQADRLFVSVGANDPFGICVKAVESLRSMSPESLGADIVVGTDEIERNKTSVCANGLPGVSVYGFMDKIAGIMAGCTLAVGAAGSSTWERCAIGLPSIVVITADNQRKMAVDLAQTGVIALLGEAADVSAGVLASAISDLIRHPVRRSTMRLDAMNLVDGQGAYRVTERIIEMSPCTN
jgi:UDP-2,4-diacetamido-2,4,6-trideoxy-beta-L-altropyranose hydrolase